jgi:hypothetical protein
MHYSHYFDSVNFPDGRNVGDELRRRAAKGSQNFTFSPAQMEAIGLRILELENALLDARGAQAWVAPADLPPEDEARNIRIREDDHV